MKLVPLTDRVVLKQLEAEETTASGIVLPGEATGSGSNRCRSWRSSRRKRNRYAGKRRPESNLFQICRDRSKTGWGRVHYRKTE